MGCYLNCSIGLVFATAAVVTAFVGPVGNHKEDFYKLLTRPQQVAYDKVVDSRRTIYLEGLVLGLLLSFLLLHNHAETPGYAVPCGAAAITLVTNYLYYTLSPKPRNTVIGLDKEEQRVAWYKVYRHMQVVYHGGLVLGILAAFFFAAGLCARSAR